MLATLIGFGYLAGLLAAQPIALTAELGDFGETYQFSPQVAQFEVSNPSDHSVEITVEAQRATDKILNAPQRLAPHSSATIEVRVTPQDEIGARRHVFAIRIANESGIAVNGQVAGFVESVFDEPRLSLDFGVVDSRAPHRFQSITLVSHDDPELKAVRVIESLDFADVAVSSDGRTIEAKVKDDAGWGIHEGAIKLALASSKQPEVWIDVKADIHGDVIPASNPTNFGVARKGKNAELLIRLDHRSGENFKVGDVGLEDVKGDVTKQECAPIRTGCKLIRLRISDNQPTGILKGRVLVSLPDFHRVVPINIWGMLVSADAQIKSLNEEIEKRRSASVTGGADLHSALVAATTEKNGPIAMATPPGTGPLLKWTVQNEKQLYGYLVYRSDAEDSPPRRINEKIIKVLSGQDGVSVEYQYRDTTAQTGHTYWYHIGTIDQQGARRDLSGALRKMFTAEPQPAK